VGKYHSKVLSKNRAAPPPPPPHHPATYPVALPEFFLSAYSDAGDVVFDPFMGSGTTLIAAEKTKRVAIGTELSARYAQVILNRWEAFTGKKAEKVS
jgi:DNA modification methylase